jgi:hypothetical protein
MWLCGRLLSCVSLLLVVPVLCHAQAPAPPLRRTMPEAVMAAEPHPSQGAPQARGLRSGRHDSLLNGAVIGLAAGAAFGIAYVHLVRDSDLDAGDYSSGALIFGGLGAAAGLGIDALVDRDSGVVARAPGRVAFGSRVTRTTAGLRVIVRW